MQRNIAMVIAVSILWAPSLPARESEPAVPTPGCVRDLECKGDRICEDGRCIYPPVNPAVRPLPNPFVKTFVPEPPFEPADFYFGVDLSLVSVQFLDWDDNGPDFTRTSNFPVNFRLGGYKVIIPGIHLGGFFRYKYNGFGDRDVNGFHTVALGSSGRFGFPVGNDGLIGLNLDVGLTLYRNARSDRALDGKTSLETDSFCLYLYPAIVYTALFGSGDLRGGLEVMFGFEIFAGQQVSLDDGDYQHVSLGPSLKLGFTIGRK